MKKIVEVHCPAKINLFLNITDYDEIKKLHNLKMINQTVNLYDIITMQEYSKKDLGIVINSDANIPLDETNSCYKACKLFFDYTKINPSTFYIYIKKNIPNMAGLGGESTDAAGVLLGLNQYYQTELSKKELASLGFQVGSDVPFFIYSGCCLVSGCGEKVTNFIKNPYQRYLLIKPNIEMSTKEMFQKFSENKLMITRMVPENLLFNDFLRVAPREIKEIQTFLKKYPNHSLSGSGSTYYVALTDNIMPFELNLSLRKEFPNYQLYNVKNTIGHKILIKKIIYKN